MQNSGLIGQGVELMLVGMGTVFAFLTILVLATGLMSWAVRRLWPEAPGPASPGSEPEPSPNELLAVIGAAVAAYRRRTKGP